MKYNATNYQIIDLINSVKKQLIQACKTKHEAEQQAIWMLEEITKKSHVLLLAEKEINLTKEDAEKLNEWIRQRVEEKKPLQYILGFIPFLNLKIKTVPPILIPRPETEEWVDWLIKKLKNVSGEIRILDIGTGSGCIALGLAKNLPNAFVTGIDINPKAITLAEQNLELNNITSEETFNVNVKFIVSDFYNNLDSKYKFDIIVSNPPYICNDEWLKLDDTVKNWEDKGALVAQHKTSFVDCLYAYKTIINEAKKHLRQNENLQKNKINIIFLEMGVGQEKDLILLFEKNGYRNIEFFEDLEGKQRVISARF